MTRHLCIDGRRIDKGGIGRVTTELVAALAAADGVQLSVLVPSSAEGQFSSTPGLRTVACDIALLSPAEVDRLPKMIEATDASVFVAPQFYTVAQSPVPMVSWVHDTWPLCHPEWLPPVDQVFAKFGAASESAGRGIVRHYQRLRQLGQLFPQNRWLAEREKDIENPLHRFVVCMYSLNLHRSRAVVTCSDFSRNSILELYPEMADRVHVVYNPIPRFVAGGAGEQETRPGALLHVSKWEPRKNIPRLIRAFARLVAERADARLQLVGSPVSAQDGVIVRKAIEQCGVGDRVEIYEGIDDDRLRTLYRRSQALVMPSLYEGFSLPIAEAMASGLPVAAARRAAIPEVLGDAALYFDPEDEQEMFSAMRRMLDDDPLRGRLIARGHQRVKELRARDFATEVLRVLDRMETAA